jgi:hypothetical protein
LTTGPNHHTRNVLNYFHAELFNGQQETLSMCRPQDSKAQPRSSSKQNHIVWSLSTTRPIVCEDAEIPEVNGVGIIQVAFQTGTGAKPLP